MTRVVMRYWVFAVVFALSAGAFAIESAAPFADPAMQARYEHIAKELRCLVCQNQTIADSNAPLAADLRQEVREMLIAGKTDDEIQNFMVERYGDWILYRPRLSTQTLLLWAAPGLLVLLGLGIAVRVIAKRARLYRDEPDA